MRILVTGGTGFVGRWAAAALEASGAEVFVCTRQSKCEDGRNFLTCDLLDSKAADALLAQVRPDIVLHAAWYVEHGSFWNSPANLEWAAATMRLMEAAKNSGVRRFVGIGTCFEYEWPDQGDCVEKATPVRPTSLYAVTKDATRRIAEEFIRGSGLEFAWARLFYLFGPNEHRDRLASSVAIRLAQKRQVPLSSAIAVRDFMDVRDAGAALAALTVSAVTGPVNIGTGQGIRIADLAKELLHASGGLGQLQFGALPDRPGEPRRIVADVERLRNEVGYQPTTPVRERLKETYNWWAQNIAQENSFQ